jgi:hypothetical protein
VACRTSRPRPAILRGPSARLIATCQRHGRKAGMDLELDGRTAAVIGGSSGIGAAVAGVLAEEGCDVAVIYRHAHDGAQQTASGVRGHGRRAWVVPLELDRPESATTAAEALAAQVGGLDTVVLYAGHNVVTPFGQITPSRSSTRSSRSISAAPSSPCRRWRRWSAPVASSSRWPAWPPTPGRRTTCTMRPPRPGW